MRCGCYRASHGNIRTAHTTYAAALKTTIHPNPRCRKPYAETQHLMLLMMGVCTRNKSNINKITLLHQVDNSNYFTRKMHVQTTLTLFYFLFYMTLHLTLLVRENRN